MGRKRKSDLVRRSKINSRSVVHSDEEADRGDEDPNPLSRSYVYDEIDEFHANREKILVEGEGRLAARSHDQSDSEQEEVYALSGEDSLDDDDDDDDDVETNLAYFQALANKDRDDLASDLEDQEDADLPNVKAWGADKSTFYNTDFVDKDRGYFKDYEVRLADAEEKEAMDMQKRLLEQLDDDDFGMELLQKAKTMQSDREDGGSKIVRDISGMSKNEKLEVVRRESPELMNLLEDFRAKLLEIKNVVQPLVDLVDEKKIPLGPGADYLHLKHRLLLNYCTNVCFYVTLKAERADTNNHPIIKRLVSYRKLMKELQTVDVLMADQIAAILNFARSGKDVSKLFEETVNANVAVPEGRQQQANSRLKRKDVVDDDDDDMEFASKSVKEKLVHDPLLTTDETEALNLYSLMKAGRDRNQSGVDDESLDDDDGDHEAADRITNEQIVDFVGKRKITSQIEKNKGLTPYRKKDRRNPRVNNRNKYRKAKIRRKGQVQDVRRELKKYKGEISGIRVGTSRSTKLH